jgi:hypothetical protein
MSFLEGFSQYRKILLRLLGLQDLVEGGELAILVFLGRVAVFRSKAGQGEPDQKKASQPFGMGHTALPNVILP